MIFVILGIAILVISFVVALVSLLREQSKLDEEVEETRADVPLEVPEDTAGVPKPSLSEATNGILSDYEKVDSGDFKAPAADIDRKLFPWEEVKKTEDSQKLPEQDEIERIRKELQNIKRQEPQQEPQVSEPVRTTRDDLSGEVTISDLRKGTDRF